MRKFLGFTIGGLQQKIFNIFLITMVLVTAAFVAVITYQTNELSSLVAESNANQKASIQTISDSTMDQVLTGSMYSSGQVQANYVNSMFKTLASGVEMLQMCTDMFMNNTEELILYPIDEPPRENTGEVVLQLLAAPGVDLNSKENLTKSGLLGNLEEIMISLVKTTDLASTFVGVPEGFFLMADDKPASRYDENGNLMQIDARERWWYQGAVEAGGVYFSDIETDFFTGRKEIVCAAPVYVDGELVAVVGADLFIDELALMISTSYSDSSFICVINQDGHTILAPEKQDIFTVYSAERAPDLRKTASEIGPFVRAALDDGDNGVRTVTVDGREYYMAGFRMPAVGWILVMVLDKAVATMPSDMMNASLQSISNRAMTNYAAGRVRSQRTMVVLLVVVFLLGTVGATFIANRVVKPLEMMTKKIADMKGGNFDFHMEKQFRTKDEVQVLAESFADMSKRTKGYIKEITDITAEKERIGAELNVATQIQADMLPSLFPAFPDKKEFDLFASMKPAKEVGGDFYDFFFTDPTHLAMVIADVSGKGVPAALFMVIAKTLLKNRTQLGGDPVEIMANVNRQLCEGNEAGMFVTVWLGIMDVETGEVVSVNAGHEHPAIRHANGEFVLDTYPHSPVMGVMETAKFTERRFKLDIGDTLFVYTDGVVEANSPKGELYGDKRLLDVLNRNPDADPREVLSNVREGVHEFMAEADQFDDITMLCVKYKGKAPTIENS